MSKRFHNERYGIARSKRKAITLEMKLEVIRRTEAGEKVCDIRKALGLVSSTVCTIQKEALNIKKKALCGTPLNASRLTRNRSDLLDKMEDKLNAWIDEQNKKGLRVYTRMIQEKARLIFDELKMQSGSETSNETFMASSGWYAKFKKRNELIQCKTNEETIAYCEKLAKDCENGSLSALEITVPDKTKKILDLAMNAGLEDFNEEDIQELLEYHNEKLVSKALIQIKKERDMSSGQKSDFIVQNLRIANDFIHTALAFYTKYDPDQERSNEVCRKIRETIACYEHLQTEKENQNLHTSSDLGLSENESNLPSTSQKNTNLYDVFKEEIISSSDLCSENDDESMS